MSRRPSRTATSRHPDHETDGGSRFASLRRLLATCGVATWFARWLLPTESTWVGETLWLVVIWSLLWFCDWLIRLRERSGPVSPSFALIGLWLIIAGQCAAGCGVLFTGGQSRAAINGCWEWIGIGISTTLMARWVSTTDDRQALTSIIVLLLAVLAGLGIWQHYVWYPATAAEYRKLLNEYDELKSNATLANANAISRGDRLREIERRFSEEGVPTEGQSRKNFEQRLFESTEPIGFFALTNSFAGLLATGFVLGLMGMGNAVVNSYGSNGQSISTSSITLSRWRWGFPCLSLITIAYCLMLTKSRTAWIGAFIVLAIGGILILRKLDARLAKRVVFIVLALASIIVIVPALSGGIDREVVSEASKSLRYRQEFWTGTVRVIREHPWLGVGPGNFRSHYLRHKLVESSEEIVDPHQLVLDLWSHGGLISVAGLCVMIAAVLWAMIRQMNNNDIAVDSGSSTPEKMKPNRDRHDGPAMLSARGWYMGAFGAFLLVIATQFLTGIEIDRRIVVCGLVFGCLIPAWRRASISWSDSRMTWGLATLALFIHLQGAGGISMPAIAQLMFLMPLIMMNANGIVHDEIKESTSHHQESRLFAKEHPAWSWLMCAISAIIAAGVIMTGYHPVRECRRLMAEGDYILQQGQATEIAVSYYKKAADADPWNPEPLERLSRLTWGLWESKPEEKESLFTDAVRLQRRANALDPLNHHGYRVLGEWLMKRYDRTGSVTSAKQAVDEWRLAASRYPSQPVLQLELARASLAAGLPDDCRAAATRALELDAINHKQGHVDKYLTAQQLEELGQMIE